MNMVRYDPWDIDRLQNEINRLFSGWGDTESTSATADWVPTVDINEYGDRFELFVDVPGVDPKSVDIRLDNSVLTINGERPAPTQADEDENMIRRRTERGYGRFHRRFILPDTVDADNVKAADRDGVLEIKIAKHAKAQPRRIPIAA